MDRIRLATPDDAEEILRIYGPICAETAITFDVTPPPVDILREDIARVTREFPWLIHERGGAVAGYVYASRHRDRAAYQWAVTTSIYLDPSYHRQGIGRKLYGALFGLLKLQGYYTAYAGITLPNDASVGLHESLGFHQVGVYTNVGFKLGAWLDVGCGNSRSVRPATTPRRRRRYPSLWERRRLKRRCWVLCEDAPAPLQRVVFQDDAAPRCENRGVRPFTPGIKPEAWEPSARRPFRTLGNAFGSHLCSPERTSSREATPKARVLYPGAAFPL